MSIEANVQSRQAATSVFGGSPPRDRCVECGAKLNPGRAGRKCKECREPKENHDAISVV